MMSQNIINNVSNVNYLTTVVREKLLHAVYLVVTEQIGQLVGYGTNRQPLRPAMAARTSGSISEVTRLLLSWSGVARSQEV